MSEKGWIRALKGHLADLRRVQFKGDDSLKTSFFTRDHRQDPGAARPNGKFYTLEASKLPGGRGFGDPIRLMADLEEGADFIARLPLQARREAAGGGTDGRGFVVPTDEVVANTRKGKQVLNVDAPATRRSSARRSRATTWRWSARTASSSSSRSTQMPEMARGKGVRLQRYKDGGISDAKVFKLGRA